MYIMYIPLKAISAIYRIAETFEGENFRGLLRSNYYVGVHGPRACATRTYPHTYMYMYMYACNVRAHCGSRKISRRKPLRMVLKPQTKNANVFHYTVPLPTLL